MTGTYTYPSFLKISPDIETLWYGITNGPNGDEIFSYNIETGTWSEGYSLLCNFDMEFIGEHILVSGLNSTNWSDPNCISLLDVSGNDNHRKIIDVGGYSAGLSIDDEGNVYYATSGVGSEKLYRWDMETVINVINDSSAEILTLDDATILSSIPAGAYDTDVDEAGNVFFDFSDYATGVKNVVMWNGNEGDNENFEILAYSNDPAVSLTLVNSKGNFMNGGKDNGIIAYFLLTSLLLRAQYIVDVLEYVPAPGQFVNTSTAGSPIISTNSIMNGLTGCLTLGSFGGYVVFKFENPVDNHPDNPYGVDFTIFGNPNAMPGTNHALTAEPGIVYVMKDENANGIPDNPYTRERENSGGDAFDISWAIDENNNYVDLDEIDFVKVQSAVLADGGWIGEISTEIAGAIDIEPDASINGIESVVVIKDLPKEINTQNYQLEAFVFHQGRYLKEAEITWETSLDNVNIDENHVLTFSNYGEVEITAKWKDNPDIYTIITSKLIKGIGFDENYLTDLNIYPNPVKNHFYVETDCENLDIEIYDIIGRCTLAKENIDNKTIIDISDLKSGVYFIRINNDYHHYSIIKI